MRWPRHPAVGLVLVLLLASLLFTWRESPPARAAAMEFVFASGLDRGPSGIPAVTADNQSPGAGVLQWQTGIKRTGDGAYHMVGGDLTGEMSLVGGIGNGPFGGLELWIGAAFRFVSFQQQGLLPMWLMAAAPTDGILGADMKPVIAVTSDGHLQLTDSAETITATSSLVLALHKWY